MAHALSHPSSHLSRKSQRYKLNTIRESIQSFTSSSSEEARIHALNSHAIRRIRTEFYSRRPEERYREDNGQMERKSSQRRGPLRGDKSTEESSFPLQDVSPDNYSGRHRQEESTSEDDDAERVYVYKYLEEDDDEDNTVSVRQPRYSTYRQEASFRAPSQLIPVENLARPVDRRDKDRFHDTKNSPGQRRLYHDSGTIAKEPAVQKSGMNRAMSTTSSRSMVKRWVSPLLKQFEN